MSRNCIDIHSHLHKIIAFTTENSLCLHCMNITYYLYRYSLKFPLGMYTFPDGVRTKQDGSKSAPKSDGLPVGENNRLIPERWSRLARRKNNHYRLIFHSYDSLLDFAEVHLVVPKAGLRQGDSLWEKNKQL